jgi:hypothetical protein
MELPVDPLPPALLRVRIAMIALFQARPPPTTIFFDFNTLQEASQSPNDWLLPYAVNARL